jgi:hypothetical protein
MISFAVNQRAHIQSARLIFRIDQFVNTSFLKFAVNTNYLVFAGCGVSKEESRIMTKREHGKVPSKTDLGRSRLANEYYDAMISHNRCVATVISFVGMVSFLVNSQCL